MESALNKQQAKHEINLGKTNVEVPVHGPGNVIKHVNVDFNIFKDNKNYIAYPSLNNSKTRLTGLPRSITFNVKNDWVNCEQKEFKYVAVDIYNELKKKNKK